VETVKVSPKFQIVIPEKVREELQLKPGQELQIYILDGTVFFASAAFHPATSRHR
jgi:AbrB family looped-hinge helix DNA binding protein